MSQFTLDEGSPIRVEFAPQPGVEDVSWVHRSAEEVAARSQQALDQAMDTIRHMAQRLSSLRHELPAEFTEVELEFGIKLTWEAGALLAKAGAEGNLKVTLTWEREDDEDEKADEEDKEVEEEQEQDKEGEEGEGEAEEDEAEEEGEDEAKEPQEPEPPAESEAPEPPAAVGAATAEGDAGAD